MEQQIDDLKQWIKGRLFNLVPIAIAVIDQQYNIVYANRAFGNMFGSWQNRKCYDVYKKRDSICENCRGAHTFKDGTPRITNEIGYGRDGKPAHYTKHTLPFYDGNGDIPYLIEMSIDVTDLDQTKRELKLLFDQVPCNISLLNKDLRIVRANQKLLDKFGNVEGRYCYEVFKGLDNPCDQCPARRTFKDGEIHTGQSIVRNKMGDKVVFQVTTAPLERTGEDIELVMEMAVDVSEIVTLKDDLATAHSFLETIISASIDGIIAVNNEGLVTVFNSAARMLFQVDDFYVVNMDELVQMLPIGFLDQVNAGPGHVYLSDTKIKTLSGEEVSARLIGVRLLSGEEPIGMAFSIQDLTQLKELERATLDAERLAAVGQTVAGLAHGVKNLIAGLEGGMYMLSSGIKKGEGERIVQGWDILDRNIGRISTFVKAFLTFSRGREICTHFVDPVSVAKEVVDLYSLKAKKQNVELILQKLGEIHEAPLDSEGIHESLTNLVGNAIDACQMSDNDGQYHVQVKVMEKDDAIIYEVVDDGCGMDYEVKKKVFTNFFTSKGLGGTGIGLLQTRKIIQEHGGRIDVESEEGEGSTFRVILPRKRLPLPLDEQT